MVSLQNSVWVNLFCGEAWGALKWLNPHKRKDKNTVRVGNLLFLFASSEVVVIFYKDRSFENPCR